MTLRGRPQVWVLLVAVALAVSCGSPPADLAARSRQVRDMLEAEEFPQVLEATRILLRDAQEQTGADSAATAEAIELRVRAQFEGGIGDSSQMLALAERGLAIRERLLEADNPGLAAMLEARSGAFIRLQDFDRAVDDRRRALAIREKAFVPDSVAMAQALLSMAEMLIWSEVDDVEAAKLVARIEAIVARTAGPRDVLAGRALIIKANILETAGQFPEARAAYEQALQIYEAALPPDHPRIATCLTELSYLLVDMGDFVRARASMERAVMIVEKKFPDSRLMTSLLMNLGAAQAESGDIQQAIATLSRAVANADVASGPTSVGAGVTRNRLAVAYIMAGEFSLALAPCERALAIQEAILGPDDRETTSTRNNLGFLLLNMGEYAAARPHLERAYAASAKAYSARSPARADLLSSLADLELAVGNLDRAGALYTESKAMRLAMFGPDHPAVTRALTGLVRVDLAAGRPMRALDKALQAERRARTDFQATARSLSEREALAYEAIRVSGLDLAISALEDAIKARTGSAREIRRTWDAVVHSRAMVLDEMTERRRVMSDAADKAAQEPMARLTQARDQLAHMMASGPGDKDFVSRLGAAREEEQQAEGALAEVSADFRRLSQRSAVGLSDVLGALPASTALIGYVHYERPRPVSSSPSVTAGPSGPAGRDRKISGVESYAAFVVSAGNGASVFVPLGPAAPIEAAIKNWRETAAAGQTPLATLGDAAEQQYRITADRLRRLVWDPIEPLLGKASRALIVPDGALGFVSFATLPTGSDRYLVETGPTIHYLSAERDAAAYGNSSPTGRGMMALGGPDFDASPAGQMRVANSTRAVASSSGAEPSGSRRSACVDLASARFQPLPAARLEAENLAALWRKAAGAAEASGDGGDVLVRVGAQASEPAFKLEAHGRRIVHLATHAFVAGGECASAIDGLRGGRIALAEQNMLGPAGENPLLLSGLALAGANLREQARPGQDDGILTGEEIASLDFTGTEWVVLSACDTGVGKVQNGEGILGLRRAFETAGAQTLIMSLWSVEDEATRQWMGALYSDRLSGKSTAESVRGADRAILEARRRAGRSTRPFFWGGFVATGSWR